jgi:ribosomal protein S18 acetylase RimI-like enzyme
MDSSTGTQNVIFRSVKNLTDAETVEYLAKEIWEQHYVPIIGKSQVEYMLEKFQSSSAVLSDIEEKGYEYVVLEHHGYPAGYYSVRFQANDRALFLSKFYIRRSARGLGLGRLMLDHMTEAHDPASIWLTVNKQNTNTIEVYRHLGFEIEKTQVVDIGDGFSMDDYVMRKQI